MRNNRPRSLRRQRISPKNEKVERWHDVLDDQSNRTIHQISDNSHDFSICQNPSHWIIISIDRKKLPDVIAQVPAEGVRRFGGHMAGCYLSE